jgi:hypothetical protein
MSQTFPLVREVLKTKTKQLSEAEWNGSDQHTILQLRFQIRNLEIMLENGEEYIIPF